MPTWEDVDTHTTVNCLTYVLANHAITPTKYYQITLNYISRLFPVPMTYQLELEHPAGHGKAGVSHVQTELLSRFRCGGRGSDSPYKPTH